MRKAQIAGLITCLVGSLVCVQKLMVQRVQASQVSESAGVPLQSPPRQRLSPVDGLWSYSGENGPSMWAALRSDFAVCGAGSEQSPIDISHDAKTSARDLLIRYVPEDARVLNNGHAIQAATSGTSKIFLKGHEFHLDSVVVHSPSEHSLDGFQFPLEIQFAHSDSEGKRAMVSALVEKGNVNMEFEKVVRVLDSSLNEIGVKVSRIDFGKVFPANANFWRYQGSLTSPPCTENTAWSVYAQTIEMSEDQIAAFRALIPFNARPVQPLSGRKFDTGIKTIRPNN